MRGMRNLRVPILVNEEERSVDGKLADLCARYGARLFPKLGIKDVLPIRRSGLSDDDFHLAMTGHFDFVVAGPDNVALLAIEYDEDHHRTDPAQQERDQRKNGIAEHFMLPLLRARASSLRKADHRTLLEWLLEVWFEQRKLSEQKDAMYDDPDWDGDPLEIDSDRLNYREAWALRDESGHVYAAPLDAFHEARERISRWYWSRPVLGRPRFECWYRGGTSKLSVGHVALEVVPGGWLVGSGRVDLGGFWRFTFAVLPPQLAQDIALLSLADQLERWQRGEVIPTSDEGLTRIVSGCKPGALTWLNLPDRYELAKSLTEEVRSWGGDVDERAVFVDMYDALDPDRNELQEELRAERREDLRRWHTED